MQHTLRPGGLVPIATFAPDGPTRCSGLDVMRYSPTALADLFGEAFPLVRSLTDGHHTPTGAVQHFRYAVFRRRNCPA